MNQTPQHIDTDRETLYALAKQVPDMERGFTINTRYGDIEITAEEADEIVAATRRVLEKRSAPAKEEADTGDAAYGKPVIILYGPPGIGKTFNALVIAKAFGCNCIIDGEALELADRLYEGTLAITNDDEVAAACYDLASENYRLPCVLIDIPDRESMDAFAAALNRVSDAADRVRSERLAGEPEAA
ncbi:MAG: hypothetical protein FWC38_00885 [Proteobacteria bacterium]|nr:hypothetical protein [Pseudomonadota bacterium]